jgi:hypothetical protein
MSSSSFGGASGFYGPRPQQSRAGIGGGGATGVGTVDDMIAQVRKAYFDRYYLYDL